MREDTESVLRPARAVPGMGSAVYPAWYVYAGYGAIHEPYMAMRQRTPAVMDCYMRMAATLAGLLLDHTCPPQYCAIIKNVSWAAHIS